jgi:2-hydroxy-3-oxopropionate reductase
MNIGYIGLGHMGRPCALNLIKAGHSLFVWARRRESAAPVLEQGATWCGSPAETAARCDVIFLNVTNTEDVESIIFGLHGIAESDKRGLIIVDMSTISATATRAMNTRLESRGMELVDAPVSGGTVGAVAGTLTVMVGAREETFERIKPLLMAMGKTITRIGECGAGQAA